MITSDEYLLPKFKPELSIILLRVLGSGMPSEKSVAMFTTAISGVFKPKKLANKPSYTSRISWVVYTVFTFNHLPIWLIPIRLTYFFLEIIERKPVMFAIRPGCFHIYHIVQRIQFALRFFCISQCIHRGKLKAFRFQPCNHLVLFMAALMPSKNKGARYVRGKTLCPMCEFLKISVN
jgi:hypothetical protein